MIRSAPAHPVASACASASSTRDFAHARRACASLHLPSLSHFYQIAQRIQPKGWPACLIAGYEQAWTVVVAIASGLRSRTMVKGQMELDLSRTKGPGQPR